MTLVNNIGNDIGSHTYQTTKKVSCKFGFLLATLPAKQFLCCVRLLGATNNVPLMFSTFAALSSTPHDLRCCFTKTARSEDGITSKLCINQYATKLARKSREVGG
ncbi:hypothetical protein MRX96_040963 [Rhipicephalus microplus]